MRKEAICRGISEPGIVARAICPQDVAQLRGCNRLITYRWISIESVGQEEQSAPTSAQHIEPKSYDWVQQSYNTRRMEKSP